MVMNRIMLHARQSMEGIRTYNSRRCGQHHRKVQCTLPGDQQWQGGNGETVQQPALQWQIGEPQSEAQPCK